AKPSGGTARIAKSNEPVKPAPAPTEQRPPAALSPAVKKLVADAKVDPAAIPGTGKDGRITKGDVLAHGEKDLSPTTDSTAPSAQRPAPGGGVTRKKMSPLRSRIAQRLVQAQHTAAILTTFNEIDMQACMDMRKRFKEEFEKKHGVGLGFMSFFGAAVMQALKKYPLLNAQIDGGDIVSFDGVHLGVAVGTEKGLVVPVLRYADRMSFAQIEQSIKNAALKARDGKLAIDDMQGGTFTITNGGVYGSLMSTPIINPPQSGILGMHAIKERPIALNGQVVIRPMMYVALSYDHRIVDGSEAVGFLVRIKELIEAPERLVLGL
nr:2-oxoglutarate dehydrogenase complex dihydrolipoyllysine-residue succinyltransferase [Planctomycetota bacterium]